MRTKTAKKMTITECRNLLRAEYGLDLYKPKGIDIYYANNDDMEIKLTREEVTGDPEKIKANLKAKVAHELRPEYRPYFG